MAAEIVIDRDECLGCEACTEECPSVFEIKGDDGKAHVIDGPTLKSKRPSLPALESAYVKKNRCGG